MTEAEELELLELEAEEAQAKATPTLNLKDIKGAPKEMSPTQYAQEKALPALLKMANWTGSMLDRWAGAPSRQFVDKALMNPDESGSPWNPLNDNLVEGAAAFLSQIGRDPKLAPTGKQIFQKMGVSTRPLSSLSPKNFSESGEGLLTLKKGGPLDVSPAGLLGLGGDVAFDYSNIVPIGLAAKVTGKGALKGTGALLKTGGKATDIATGTNIAEKVTQGSKAFSETLGQGLKATFSGKRAEDYTDMLKIAERNGIDPKLLPASVEYGKASTISRAARAKGEGPAGELLRKNHEAVVKQIDGAMADHVNKLSGGQIYKADDVGEIIRDGFDRGVNKAFDELDVTYSSVMQDHPGLQIQTHARINLDNKLKNLEGRMRAKVKRGASDEVKSSARQVLNTIEAIRESNGSYKQTLEQLREIGEVAFSTGRQFKTPPDEKILRKLYGDLREALVETADGVSPVIGDQLRKNNEIASELIGEKSLISKKLRNKDISNEAVFKNLIVNGDSQRLRALKRFLTPEEWGAVKGSFMRDIMKENVSGDLAGGTIFNKLRDKENIIDALFEPGEMDNFVDLLKLKDRVGSPVLSSSGTGASNAFLNLAKETLPRAAESGISKVITTKKALPKKPPHKLVRAAKTVAKKSRQPALKASQVYSVQQQNGGE